MCFPQEAGSKFYKKRDRSLKEKALQSMKGRKKIADRKWHSQNSNCYADNRFCRRGLEAKNARDSGHRRFLKGAWGEHIANRASNWTTRAGKNDKLCFFVLPFGCQKSDFVDRKCSRSFFRNALPTAARSTFLKKSDTKSDLKHESHERGTLKLAFSMQIRNKFHPA